MCKARRQRSIWARIKLSSWKYDSVWITRIQTYWTQSSFISISLFNYQRSVPVSSHFGNFFRSTCMVSTFFAIWKILNPFSEVRVFLNQRGVLMHLFTSAVKNFFHFFFKKLQKALFILEIPCKKVFILYLQILSRLFSLSTIQENFSQREISLYLIPTAPST